MIHPNSKKSYDEEKPKLSQRHKEIIETIVLKGMPMTDRQVLWAGGFGDDMNCVRPRITELIKANQLEEFGSTKCEITGKTVRLVRLYSEPEELPCAREIEETSIGKSWTCVNDHTGCLWNNGHNECVHDGHMMSPLGGDA